ncbi:MAG TPA: response regulator [Chthoniobacterales bacterium]
MTVFIVDDEGPVRRALGRLLRSDGFEVVAFASAEEFLTGCGAARPACVVLDMAMPGRNGLEVQQALKEAGNTLPIIFLTGRADVPMCAQAMKRGASDFLTKPINDADLLAAVRRALSADRADGASQAERDAILTRLASLTPREREVLDLVAAGRLNKQIAAELGTVEKTIKVHRGRVMAKMGAHSVADLVRMMERGLR